MNRALRRQQLKEPKSGKSSAAPKAIPSTGPSKSSRTSTRTGGGGILSWRPRFAMDIIAELRKVVWPTREDVVHLTFVVVVVTVIMGAVLGLIDIGIGWLIDKLLLQQ
jgi:preprotein translocase subunit SecE